MFFLYYGTFLQDFGFFGNNGAGQGLKWGRNGQKGVKGGGDEDHPSTPLAFSRSSSMRKSGTGEEVSVGELSPGLLDLHSFDTELIPEVFRLFLWSTCRIFGFFLFS